MVDIKPKPFRTNTALLHKHTAGGSRNSEKPICNDCWTFCCFLLEKKCSRKMMNTHPNFEVVEKAGVSWSEFWRIRWV
jgi:hypothetical protein